MCPLNKGPLHIEVKNKGIRTLLTLELFASDVHSHLQGGWIAIHWSVGAGSGLVGFFQGFH